VKNFTWYSKYLGQYFGLQYIPLTILVSKVSDIDPRLPIDIAAKIYNPYYTPLTFFNEQGF